MRSGFGNGCQRVADATEHLRDLRPLLGCDHQRAHAADGRREHVVELVAQDELLLRRQRRSARRGGRRRCGRGRGHRARARAKVEGLDLVRRNRIDSRHRRPRLRARRVDHVLLGQPAVTRRLRLRSGEGSRRDGRAAIDMGESVGRSRDAIHEGSGLGERGLCGLLFGEASEPCRLGLRRTRGRCRGPCQLQHTTCRRPVRRVEVGRRLCRGGKVDRRLLHGTPGRVARRLQRPQRRPSR